MIDVKNIRRFAILYASCTMIFFIWLAINNLTFTSYEPVFLTNQMDITGNYILYSGIHIWVMKSAFTRILLDALFVVLPWVLVVMFMLRKRVNILLAIAASCFSLIYAWLFSVLNVISIEVFTAFIFTPLVFTSHNLKGLNFRFYILRFIFLVTFFSTAIWKIRAGGLFNADQMQAILFRQHTAVLAYGTENGFTQLIKYLLNHPTLAQSLFWLATIAEGLMVIGLITRTYDRMLLLLAILFVVLDYTLMEINYFTWIPMIATLYFSKKEKIA